MDISPYLAIPALALAVRQLINISASKSIKELRWGELLDLSSQPDWLSCVVWSTIPVTFFVHGINSPWLATNVLLGLLLMRQQAAIGATLKQRLQALGLGILSGAALSFNYWKDDLDWLLGRPADSESQAYLIIFAALLVLGEFLVLRMRRKDLRRLPTSRSLQRTFRFSISVPALYGLFVALLQNQTRNDFMTDRLYIYLAFTWVVVATAWASQAVYKNARVRLAEEAEHFNKQKKKAKKKKRKSKKR